MIIILLILGIVFSALWIGGSVIACSNGQTSLAIIAIVIPPVGVYIAVKGVYQELNS